MNNSIVKLDNVVKKYGKKEAIKGISLEIPKGKIVGLLGPNGSGKSTMIKMLNGLLQPDCGSIEINGIKPSIETKKIVSYLPERTYLSEWMKMKDLLTFFSDFYEDFDIERAKKMIEALDIDINQKIKNMSKGTKEKVQLILVMSRNAQLYLLDEPIAGVDPAAREYIMGTIINNYNPEGTVLISTHLISDIERILDEVIFIKDGEVIRHEDIDDIKEKEGKSIDEVFRDAFRMTPYKGYSNGDNLRINDEIEWGEKNDK